MYHIYIYKDLSFYHLTINNNNNNTGLNHKKHHHKSVFNGFKFCNKGNDTLSGSASNKS